VRYEACCFPSSTHTFLSGLLLTCRNCVQFSSPTLEGIDIPRGDGRLFLSPARLCLLCASILDLETPLLFSPDF